MPPDPLGPSGGRHPNNIQIVPLSPPPLMKKPERNPAKVAIYNTSYNYNY